jgi:hypothetical protein
MALPVRRREQTTSRSRAAWEPLRELEELQRRTAELMESVRVPKPEHARPRRVEVQPANTP